MTEKHQCSTCRWWTRGGMGVGRGGGYCLRWDIPKTPANKITNIIHSCWEPKRVPKSLSNTHHAQSNENLVDSQSDSATNSKRMRGGEKP